MMAIHRMLARLRWLAAQAIQTPAIKGEFPPACELLRAQEKRRLERLLRDHGMTRAQASNVARDYFRKSP